MVFDVFLILELLKSVVYYVVMLGGKCVCFVLCYVMVYLKLNNNVVVVCCVVVVVELIYCYFLVYDDLLCMDNDFLCCG